MADLLSPPTLPAASLPPAAAPLRLPYAAASFTQRQQALLSARQVLAAAYPQLADAAWVTALDRVQPPLLLPAEGAALLAPEGLAALVGCLAAGPPAAGERAPAPAAHPPPAPATPDKKQTYAIELPLIEQLANTAYWLHRSITGLVNEALTQLLAQHPEAQRPRPADPPARRRRAKPTL